MTIHIKIHKVIMQISTVNTVEIVYRTVSFLEVSILMCLLELPLLSTAHISVLRSY